MTTLARRAPSWLLLLLLALLASRTWAAVTEAPSAEDADDDDDASSGSGSGSSEESGDGSGDDGSGDDGSGDDGSGDDDGSGSGDGSGDSGESDEEDTDWRDNALIYHLWPRAFQDSDGDGEGDLQGIISRLDYLEKLGVNAIRLGPIFTSPLVDSGFDVLNHTEIDPLYGDFNDFYELVNDAHKRGLKIMLDIIPNFSSDKHSWFNASVYDVEPYDDYYIWADGKEIDNAVYPPNNWKSEYSDKDGSAWSWNPIKKQWYYHKYHKSEPDLNLRNEDVVEEILDIFDFWLERGVDGFCITGASYLFEEEDLPDESSEEEGSDENDDDDESHTVGESENVDLLIRFREHIDQWVVDNDDSPKLLLAEIDEDDDEIESYYGNETQPGIAPLNLMLITKLNESSDADDVKDLIEDWLKDLPEGAETVWMLSNADYSRAASRLDSDLLDGLYMLIMLMPGQVVTYYGEELGMTNTNISWEDTIDLKGLEQTEERYDDFSRDPFRTPMQWDNTTNAGFSTNETTFLPVNPNYLEVNVQKQLRDPNSNLEAFRKLTYLRQFPIFKEGDHELTAIHDNQILIMKRTLENDTCLIVINFGKSKEIINLEELYSDLDSDLLVMVDSSNADVEKENDEDNDKDVENDVFVLHPEASAVLCDRDYFVEFSTEATTEYNSYTTDDEDDDESTSEDDESHSTTTTTEESNPVTEVVADSAEASEVGSSSELRNFQYATLIYVSLLLLLRIL